jgi:hypothetical protein
LSRAICDASERQFGALPFADRIDVGVDTKRAGDREGVIDRQALTMVGSTRRAPTGRGWPFLRSTTVPIIQVM